MKIVSWNVNSINVRIDHLKELINNEKPDLILLQEIKCEESGFPFLSGLGYEIAILGQKSYNGVAILSRYKICSIEQSFANNPISDQARFIEITCETIFGLTKIVSLYAPNGGEVNSHKFKQKIAFYSAFKEYLDLSKLKSENIIIGGDFNIAPFDIDVYNPENIKNSTCFTIEERKILRSVFNSGWVDLHRAKYPDSREYSWWDYREGSYEQNKGMRIDFIISNIGIADYLKNTKLIKEYRSKPKPSDHIPVLVEFKKY